jgi:hypothetical protein
MPRASPSQVRDASPDRQPSNASRVSFDFDLRPRESPSRPVRRPWRYPTIRRLCTRAAQRCCMRSSRRSKILQGPDVGSMLGVELSPHTPSDDQPCHARGHPCPRRRCSACLSRASIFCSADETSIDMFYASLACEGSFDVTLPVHRRK